MRVEGSGIRFVDLDVEDDVTAEVDGDTVWLRQGSDTICIPCRDMVAFATELLAWAERVVK